MVGIWIPVAVLGTIGLVCGIAIAVIARKFSVAENPLVAQIAALLPGANCGGCGYAGCEAYARAVAEEGAPLNKCNACDAKLLEEFARLTGRDAGAVGPKKVAVVFCTGALDVAARRFAYNGVADCAAAQATAGGDKTCAFGCLGYGSCARACPQGAIVVEGGIARVDASKCVGCGACEKICPRHVIRVVPAEHHIHVLCSSKDKGAKVRGYCGRGCLGCSLCTKLDATGTLSMDGALAAVDYSKPPLENPALAAKCPGHCIRDVAAKEGKTA